MEDNLLTISETDERGVKFQKMFGIGSQDDPYIPNISNLPLELLVSMGKVPGWSYISKYGENPDVGTATTPEDIWLHGGDYIYDDFGTAPIAYLCSTNALDTEDILVQGLDVNGDEVTQTVTLTGQTNVSLPTPLYRVYRMKNVGSDDVLGNVSCHIDPAPVAGVPSAGSTRATILNGNNQTLMAIYSIPKGKVGFLYKIEAGMSRAQTTGVARCALKVRNFEKVFRVQKRFDVMNTGTSIYTDNRAFYDSITALSDVKITVESVSANSIGLFGSFDILLVDEDQFSTEYLQSIGQPNY